MDNEQPYNMNVGGKMIEIWEHKYGFIPGQEQLTSRSRRRFRLGGKNPNDVAASLWLLFYSRTGEETRVAANPKHARPQPIRRYPLPNVTTKPFNLFQAVTGAAQMPNHQQQLQQQYQLQQMQQMQAQQAQAAAAAAAAAQGQQGLGTPRSASAQTTGHQGHAPRQTQQQQGYPLPQYSTPAQIVPQKRTHAASQAPLTPAQHLPPEVVARLQRGEVLVDGVLQYDEPAGDRFDNLSPIDIARARFARHQEWMEEIYSVYPVSRITSSRSVPPAVLGEEHLRAEIARHEAEMVLMVKRHAETLESIRNPGGRQGRVKAALERLERDETFMDDAAIEVMEREVGIKTVPWASVRSVPITSVST